MDLLSVLNARLSKWLHERMGVLECGCSGAVQRLVTDCKSFWLSLFPPRSHEPVCKQLPCGVGGVDSLPFFSHLIFMFSLLAHIRGPFFNVWLHVRAGTLVQLFFVFGDCVCVSVCVRALHKTQGKLLSVTCTDSITQLNQAVTVVAQSKSHLFWNAASIKVLLFEGSLTLKDFSSL